MPQRCSYTIKVQATNEVQEAKLMELVSIDRQLYDVEAEKSQAAKDFGQEIKRLNKEKKALLDVIENKVVPLEVELEPRIDEQRGQVDFVRTDTGEPIPELTRALTAKERQLSLDEIQFELPPGAKPIGGEDDDEDDLADCDDEDPDDDEDEDE